MAKTPAQISACSCRDGRSRLYRQAFAKRHRLPGLHINGQLAICSSAPPASLISLGFFLGIAWSTRCRREEEIEIIACHWPYTSEHHEKSPPARPSNYPTLRPLQRLLNFTGKTKTTSSFSLTLAFILTLKHETSLEWHPNICSLEAQHCRHRHPSHQQEHKQPKSRSKPSTSLSSHQKHSPPTSPL